MLEIVKAEFYPTSYPRNRRKKHGRIHFFVKGASVLDMFVARGVEPHKEYRKLLPEVFKRLNIDAPTKGIRWSNYAGCTCACSPGFISKNIHNDIFVTVEGIKLPVNPARAKVFNS